MKNPKDAIGNLTCNLSTCSVVGLQPPALLLTQRVCSRYVCLTSFLYLKLRKLLNGGCVKQKITAVVTKTLYSLYTEP